jgi:hypothetical protein
LASGWYGAAEAGHVAPYLNEEFWRALVRQQFISRRRTKMTSERLFHWCGLAGVVGGLLLILLDLAFLAFFGDQPERVAAATTTWLILLVLSIAATYLGLLALMGFYGREIEEAGRLGLAAFIIASLGMVMNIGFLWGGAFIVPALTSAAPEFLNQVETAPPTSVAIGFISTFVLFALGWLLFAVASLRARVLPAIPLWILILGAILGFISRIVGLGIPNLLFGLSLAWLGWWLWQEHKVSLPLVQS